MDDSTKSMRPISISEAFHLLLPLKTRNTNIRSESYQIYKKTLDYTETFCRIHDKSIIVDFQTTLSNLGFNQEEIASMISLLPQTVDEAKMCIPSITRLPNGSINEAVQKIVKTI